MAGVVSAEQEQREYGSADRAERSEHRTASAAAGRTVRQRKANRGAGYKRAVQKQTEKQSAIADGAKPQFVCGHALHALQTNAGTAGVSAR